LATVRQIGAGLNYISPGRGRGEPDRQSKGSRVGENAESETVHIDAGVDKSLVSAVRAGEMERSIKHGRVTPARTRPRRDGKRRRLATQHRAVHRLSRSRRRRSAPRTKGRMTSLDDGDAVIIQSRSASASGCDTYAHRS